VLSIEAQEARQKMLLIEAGNLAETSLAEFKRLVGVEQDAAIEMIADPADPNPQADLKVGTTQAMTTQAMTGSSASGPAAALPFKAAVDQAREGRPERKSLLLRIDAAEERVAAAAAGGLPTLAAIAGYDLARPNPRIFPIQEKWKPSWDVGISLRWTIFDGGRVQAEAAEAAAAQRAIEARVREFDSAIAVEVRQRLGDLESARASIEAAEAGVRAAAEARRVIAERFGACVATNTVVLSAQTVLLQADLELTRARANAELADARLIRALGR
jgi:outer membrane protein TolC